MFVEFSCIVELSLKRGSVVVLFKCTIDEGVGSLFIMLLHKVFEVKDSLPSGKLLTRLLAKELPALSLLKFA